MNDPGRRRRTAPLPHSPGPNFLNPGCEIGVKAKQIVCRSDQTVEAGFCQTEICQKFDFFICGQFGDFGFNPTAKNQHTRPFSLGSLTHPANKGMVATKIILGNIGDIKHRLGGQQVQVTQSDSIIAGQIEGTNSLPIVQPFAHPNQNLKQGLHLLIAALRLFFGPGNPLFNAVEISQTKFGIDNFDVPDRVDLAVDMNHIIILKAADDVDHCIDLPDMTEKLVAEAFASTGTPYQSGDINKLHDCRQHLLRADNFRQGVETRIRDRHHTDIGVDGTERIVGRFGAGICQRVENGRFANVGQADDATLQSHGGIL